VGQGRFDGGPLLRWEYVTILEALSHGLPAAAKGGGSGGHAPAAGHGAWSDRADSWRSKLLDDANKNERRRGRAWTRAADREQRAGTQNYAAQLAHCQTNARLRLR